VTRWLVFNGIPLEQALLMEEWELLAHSIVFGQFHNGGLEWDWNNMNYVKPPD